MDKPPRKIKFTDKREVWASSRDATLKGEPLKPNEKSMQREVERVDGMLELMVRDVSREVMKMFGSELAKESVAMDASIAAQTSMLMNKLSKKWEKRFAEFAKEFSVNMVNRQTKSTALDLRSSLEKLSGGLTIDTSTMSQRTKDIARASIDQSTSLIKSIQSDYIAEVREGLMRSIVDSSQSYSSLRESVQSLLSDRYRVQKNKAKNVVLDQTRKVYQGLSDSRMRDAGVTQYEWIHTGGSRQPRSYHRDVLNGKIFDLNDPPVIDLRTGEKGHPGDAINCHPGGTLVNSPDGVNKLYRRFYSGELLELVTNDGVVLKATPNHPILTNSGWKPAKFINEGDYIVSAGNEGVMASEAYVDCTETKFIDLFNSAARYFGVDRARVGASRLEFHGDASNQEVEIISTNGVLPIEFNSKCAKVVSEFVFSRTDKAFDGAGVFSEGSSAELVLRSLGTPNRFIGGLASVLSLFERGIGGANEACFTLASDFNSFLDEYSSDDISGDIEALRNLELANPRGVLSNNIIFRELYSSCLWLSFWDCETRSAEVLGESVGIALENTGNLGYSSNSVKQGFCLVEKVGSEFFSGHVYNLETVSNWYIANGMITHNCKCIKRPIVKFG